MSTNFHHISVLLYECIDALHIRNGYTYVDCTTGSGSHSFQIAKRMGEDSRLICIDRDINAIEAARRRLVAFGDRVTFVHDNFGNLDQILEQLQVDNLGGVLMDLGCSSPQLDTPERGFSYQHDAPLDMRMDTDQDLTAYDVVNHYEEKELKRIISTYGEEKFAGKIASAIVKARELQPINSTVALADLIKYSIPAAARAEGHHPAKRTFQAIRIEVNHELDAIEPAIRAAAKHMRKSGRIAAISFHSLEDRLVKNTFASLATGCTCPREFPVCVCGKTPVLTLINKKPILPSPEELENNPRSRSSKLRIGEKL